MSQVRSSLGALERPRLDKAGSFNAADQDTVREKMVRRTTK